MSVAELPALTLLFDRAERLKGGHRPLIGGEVLFRAADPADRLYFLRSGSLAAIRLRVDGSRHVAGTVRPMPM